MTGVALALVSAACFGLGTVAIRAGMRTRAKDNGHFTSVAVNAVVFAAAALVVPLHDLPLPAAAAFAGGGLLTTFLGRGISMRAIRLIGPARQGAFLLAAPVIAAFLEWALLDASLSMTDITAGGVMLAGLLLVVRSRTAPLAFDARYYATNHEPGGVDESSPDSGPPPNTESSNDHPLPKAVRGYLYASLAAIAFGAGFVVAGFGTQLFPSPVAGALIGSWTALFLIASTSVVTGEPWKRRRLTAGGVPLWFIFSGVLTSVGLLTRFMAFLTLPAWSVSLLGGTQALWSVLWSHVLIGRDERLSPGVLAGVAIVTAGIAIFALRGG